MRYQADDVHFVEDFVRSWGLVPEFDDFAKGKLCRQGTCKGQSKGSKRALDTAGDVGGRGDPSARRKA